MSTRPPAGLEGHFRPRRIRRGTDGLSTGQGLTGPGREEPPRKLGDDPPPRDPSVDTFGMALFLASLSMIFGATLAAYAIFRFKEGAAWRGAETKQDLVTIALATVVLIGCDVASTRARARHADARGARRLTRIALGLAAVYMAVQAWNWSVIFGRIETTSDGPRLSMEATLFLTLTLTHAAHVLGGMIASVLVLARAKALPPRKASLVLLNRYWRFLTVVWFVLVAVVLAT